MTLKVIGVGYGRTGTLALKKALDQLGFGPCHHMYEIRQDAEQVKLWLRIAAGERPDWDHVFAGFKSQVDWPGSVFWRDLVKHYPNAKIILTERDAESWHESILKTVLPASEHGRKLDVDWVNRGASEVIYRLVLQDLFGGRLGDKRAATEIYEAHRREVLDTIPADRLLVFRVSEGWQPLCSFLGCSVPNTAFPSGNTIAEFQARKPYFQSLGL